MVIDFFEYFAYNEHIINQQWLIWGWSKDPGPPSGGEFPRHFHTQNGYKRIITAGGETSGAVTKELGFDDFYIGDSIAPGVPIMVPSICPDIKLVLKSGNFGQEDFFRKALEQTGGEL